jgi:hypothetical protein
MTTLRKLVSNALVRDGYRRSAGTTGSAHVRRLDDDFSLCVHTGPIGLRTDIAPAVGIRSDRVEQARAVLMSIDHYDWVATVGSNVGYLIDGQYRWWEEGADVALILESISAALEKLAPFASLATLADGFALTGTDGPGMPYAKVVIALLNRDAPLVDEELERARAVFCVQADEVCEQFLAFERRVRETLPRG